MSLPQKREPSCAPASTSSHPAGLSLISASWARRNEVELVGVTHPDAPLERVPQFRQEVRPGSLDALQAGVREGVQGEGVEALFRYRSAGQSPPRSSRKKSQSDREPCIARSTMLSRTADGRR